MARTLTAAQRAAIAALRSGHYSKWEAQDADGVYRDYTQYLRTDWFTGASISENIDTNTMQLNATLLRETGTLSLSPFRSDSLVNRNAGGSYATAIDAWRKWKLSVAVMREGYPPTGTDWIEMCQGRIDVIEWSGDQIQITGRGEEAVLLDFWIATERQYGSGGGVAMETTIQSLWDNNVGVATYTLYTPASPGFNMNTWTQQKGKLFPATVDVASKAGAVLRFRYDASNVHRPTLLIPNRTATPGSEVWTLGADEITAYQRVAVDKQGIRNFIKLRFIDPTLGIQTVISPWMAGAGTVACTAGAATFSSSQAGIIKTTGSNTEIIIAGIPYTVTAFNGTTGATLLSQLSTGGVPTFAASAFTLSDTLSGAGTTASLSDFERNDLELDLSYETQVSDGTKAQGMCDAIRSDTELPDLEQQIETLGAWFIQLHDYGKFEANGVHYDSPQYGGVTSIRHDIADATIKTTIGIRGKPSGAYARWREYGRATVSVGAASPPYKREKMWNDGRYTPKATDASGTVLDTDVQQSLAGTPRALAKGYQAGLVKDAGAVTFNPVYQNLPQILLRGGKAANATYPYDDFAAQLASASGFTCKAENKNKGTITARTAEFTAPLTTSAAGGTIGPATLASAPSYDTNYTARFGISVTVTVTSGGGQTTAVVAVESNDGVSGWIERATRSYATSIAGPGTSTTNFTGQEVPIADSTLGLNDTIRLKLKSITVTGPAGTTGGATLTGYDNSGGNGHGVLYNTSVGPSHESKTPDADDYITWEAFEVAT